MNAQEAVNMLRTELKYFHNIIDDIRPEHGDRRLCDGTRTVTQQVRHVAQTARWLREGAFGAGFDLNFEHAELEINGTGTLDDARAELDCVYQEWIDFTAGLSEADLAAPMNDNPIFGAAPRHAIYTASTDHTAHHRGYLAAQLRLLGIVPKMVYSE